MFYYLIQPILFYNYILIIAAVVPAVFLMRKVYVSDRLEKESPYLIKTLVIAGVLSSLIALVAEKIAVSFLNSFVSKESALYNIILYFGIVAFAEEGSKYYMMKRKTWTSHEFNCQYDGVVYGVFVSLGFALWENISYVLNFGFSVALVRAVTAIPGHACFGVFMGIFYGLSRGNAFIGKKVASKIFRILAVVIPALIHGLYDYIASSGSSSSANIGFIVFILVLFGLSFHLVGKMSKNDKYFNMNRYTDVEWEIVN